MGKWIDDTWDSLASVNLTIFLLVSLLLLSIPGTVIMQYNISNVDPGLQYNYDFWKWGERLQLFTAYHSFWYVGLLVILSLNLIACSVNRWPQMWRHATAKPVFWNPETFQHQSKNLSFSWKTKLTKEKFQEKLVQFFKEHGAKPKVLLDDKRQYQVFWQKGRWSRLANYIVHTALLVVFLGAIVSSLWGFEGAANIPQGQAVDSIIIFKEGKHSGLKPAPGGLINERLLGYRLACKDFKVEFYPDFPGRPRSFESDLEVSDRVGRVLQQQKILVNEPMNFLQSGMYVYQASYGRMGDFKIDFRVIDKKNPTGDRLHLSTKLEEPINLPKYKKQIVALRAANNVQDLGPGVQFSEVQDNQLVGKPFWVLQNYPEHDFKDRTAAYSVFLDSVKEQYFTGLQIAYDPGAPIYWTGALFMFLGTLWALFVTHRKFHLFYDNGHVYFAGSNHRVPIGFEKTMALLSEQMQGWG